MKNKKILTLILIISIAFNTISCSASNKNLMSNKTNTQNQNVKLTQAQVLEKIQEHLEKTSSVEAGYYANVITLDENKKEKDKIANYDIQTKVIYGEKDENRYPKIEQIYTKSVSLIDKKETKEQSYVNLKTNKKYYSVGDEKLKKYEGEDFILNTESDYVQALKMMLFTKTKGHFANNENIQLKMQETKDSYDFTFEGKNADLLYALDGLFALAIDTANLEQIDINFSYKISKKDFSLLEIRQELIQSAGNTTYKSIGEFKLKSINNIKQIQEIKDLR